MCSCNPTPHTPHRFKEKEYKQKSGNLQKYHPLFLLLSTLLPMRVEDLTPDRRGCPVGMEAWLPSLERVQ